MHFDSKESNIAFIGVSVLMLGLMVLAIINEMGLIS